jgi:predicted PurR-regulated permease PerM
MAVELVLSVLSITVGAVSLVLVILLYTQIKNIENKMSATFNEIKSKIGSIIRDINLINKIEYDVDMEQQANINNLSKKLLHLGAT